MKVMIYNPPKEQRRHQNQSAYYSHAFKSLSYKSKDAYPDTFMKKQIRTTRVFGGILYTEDNGMKKYALVQGRYTGKWSFPKGHLNRGESDIECTKREIAEETGLTELPDPVDCLKIGYGQYYVFKLNSPTLLIPSDNNEIMATRWVTLKEMEELSVNADVNYFRRS